MKIKKATLRDHAWISETQVKMALETENFKLKPAIVKKGVKKVLLNPQVGNYWIVFSDEGKRAGMCLTVTEWSDWRCQETLWVHSVYVQTEFRNQGIYKALYTYLKEKVTNSKKYAGLRLYVDRKNTGAQKVYEKMGMSKDHYELYEWMK